ncbi:MAG TPA: L-threonylcarbamoyladenylate synthase [Candidatus Bathyarchaeia archaeon]|nr:L-threonylcarbamoyladenylate synthase [Candidatus Bathyarchaeia archaeon]
MIRALINNSAIHDAAKIIANGGVVAFPTETVYGLGANVFNAKAVAKIFEIKSRPFFDPLIVHIASTDDLPKLIIDINNEVCLLAEKFWPGPLTLVLPKKKRVPEIVTAGLPTVAVRMPDHPVALQLIQASGCPLAAPSANKFGCISPTRAAHIKKQLTGVDFILDGGNTKIGIESTVLHLSGNQIKILRHGAITIEEILKAVPHLKVIEESNTSVASPGMLKAHYSPNKPMFILGDVLPKKFKKQRGAIVSFSGKEIRGYKIVEQLTQNEDLKEYAANLFSTLHRLEEADIEFIVAEPVPEQGLGLAIMDRLRKAVYRYRNGE